MINNCLDPLASRHRSSPLQHTHTHTHSDLLSPLLSSTQLRFLTCITSVRRNFLRLSGPQLCACAKRDARRASGEKFSLTTRCTQLEESDLYLSPADLCGQLQCALVSVSRFVVQTVKCKLCWIIADSDPHISRQVPLHLVVT